MNGSLKNCAIRRIVSPIRELRKRKENNSKGEYKETKVKGRKQKSEMQNIKHLQ
jgi:hypothetical protein